MAGSDQPSQAIVCINGHATERMLALVPAQPKPLLVAVDGGLALARRLSERLGPPDFLIGDLDSVEPSAVAQIEADGQTRIVRHPAKKNETDLELALELLVGLHVDNVLIVGVSGGRLDQVLGNLLLLASRDWPFSLDILGVDGRGHLLTPQRSWRATLACDTVVSLLPLSQEVTGVSTTGLFYPLTDATLNFGTPRGLSNVVNATASTVTLTSGKLLLIMPSDDADNTATPVN